MTFQKIEKASFFATRLVNQMSITFFLLEVGSSMIALFKALIWLYNKIIDNFKKSQKQKSYIFSSFNKISRVGSPILDFIKNNFSN